MRTIVKHSDPGGIAKHSGSHAEVTDHGSIRVLADGYDDHGPIAIYGKGTWAEVTVVAGPESAPSPLDREEPVPDESDAIRAAVVRSRQQGWEIRLGQAAGFLARGQEAEALAIIEDVRREMKP